MKPYITILVLLMAATPMAQQKPPQSPAQTMPPSESPSTKPAHSLPGLCLPGTPNCNPAEGGQPVNVRVDVSLTEHTDKGPGQPQTVTAILADRALGQTRAAFADRTILVDARPTIVGDLIRVSIIIKSEEPPRNFVPGPGKFPEGPDRYLNWTNSFAVLLPSGKPITALETADPLTKRKLSIDVKATVQK